MSIRLQQLVERLGGQLKGDATIAVDGIAPLDAAGASQYADLLLSPDQQSEVTWIAESEQIPSHVVIAREGLDAATQARFVEVMLSLNGAENDHLRAYMYGPDGYVTAEVSTYDGVRATAKRYGFLK